MPEQTAVSGYRQISVRVARDQEEILADFINADIAPGLVIEDCGNEVRLTCYIPECEIPEAKVKSLRAFLTMAGILSEAQLSSRMEMRRIQDVDWLASYQREFKATVFDDLVIKPPWDEGEYAGRMVIIVKPAMAFGTGKHETTQLCLRGMKSELRPGMRVLDLGTGSGILGIYAARSGASEVLGLDNDPDTIPNALENARLNRVEQIFSARHGSLEQVPAGTDYDLIVCNLVFPEIVSLLDPFGAILKPGGVLILSGILTEHRREMESDLAKRFSADIKIMGQNEWLCFIVRTKQNAGSI